MSILEHDGLRFQYHCHGQGQPVVFLHGLGGDPIHPFACGQALATALPNAQFAEVTPKSDDLDRHAADVRRFVSEFIHRLPTELPLQC